MICHVPQKPDINPVLANVGPASTKLAQHCTNTGCMSRVSCVAEFGRHAVVVYGLIELAHGMLGGKVVSPCYVARETRVDYMTHNTCVNYHVTQDHVKPDHVTRDT